MAGYNLPDGCMYPSDLDQHAALNGFWDEDDSDDFSWDDIEDLEADRR